MEEKEPKDRTFKRKARRLAWSLAAVLLLFVAGYGYIHYYYVFGAGVKSGTLNYVVKKGYLFKTYEGILIMDGFRTSSPGALQSNQFVFSVEDDKVAGELMRLSGKQVELSYKEYLGALPWRGYSEFIVDSILSVQPARPDAVVPVLPEE